jgi:hypothetical protein
MGNARLYRRAVRKEKLMGKGIKKKLSILLVVVMLLGGIQIPALAEENGITVITGKNLWLP